MLETARKIAVLFDESERLRVAGLVAAAVATGLIETASVASIMPFMAVVADPTVIERNELLAALHSLVGAETLSGFLVVLGLLVLAALVVANGFIAGTIWLTQRFVWSKHHQLSTRLFSRYLHQPYTYFLARNTAHLSKNLLNEVAVVARGVLVPSLEVVVRSVVTLFLMGFLVYVDPLLALVSGVVLAAAYAALWTQVREEQGRIGREQVDTNSDRYKIAAEAFGGIKELKVLGREEKMVGRFARVSERYSGITVKHEMAARIPRYLMETVAFGGILLIVIYLLASREGIGEALPVVSAFVLAGYKLMPSLQAIFAGFTTIRFNSAALDDLHVDLTEAPVGWRAGGMPGVDARERTGRFDRPPSSPWSVVEEDAAVELPLEEELVLDAVTYRYPDSDAPALREVTVRVGRGEMVALVGPTGSGKTTLVDLILGLLDVGEGAIRVDGEPLSGERLARWRATVGYVPQEIFLSDESVTMNIALGLEPGAVDGELVRWAADVAGIRDFVEGLPRGFETVVGERGVRLSGGQRQRIGIARAIYARPRVLVLDEATSALDGETEAEVTASIRALEPRPTIVWIAHRLRTIRDCDRIYVLEEGRVVARGTYDELASSDERFRQLGRLDSNERATS